MSMYNLLHGQNPFTAVLLQMIGVDQPDGKWKSGRFRDIFLNKDGTEIHLFTRNGGGNREDYFPDEITGHPNYLRDFDDDFDYTYATIVFSVPSEWKDLAKSLATGQDPTGLGEKFQQFTESLKTMTKEEIEKDPRFEPFRKIFGMIEKGESGTVTV